MSKSMLPIHIATGLGSGPTKLAAFDSALAQCGVANYNLIRLSSVIPPKSKLIIHDKKIPLRPGEWGDRLYVVMAEIRVDTPNKEAWAGIGWVTEKSTGKGLFVEHEGNSKASVEENIKDSLDALMKTRRSIEFGKIHMRVVGGVCNIKPVCAVAVAAYQVSDWDNQPHFYKIEK